VSKNKSDNEKNSKDEVTKFDKRNIEIQKYTGQQYSHKYHLKNLRTLEPDDEDKEYKKMNIVHNPPWT